MPRKSKAATATSTTITTPTPAEVVASLAPGFAPAEVKFLQAVLSKKPYIDTVESLVPNASTSTVDFTLRVRGTLKRGEASSRKGTSRGLRKATIALFIQRSGIQRERALEILTEVLVEAERLSEDAEKKLLEEHPEVETAFDRLDVFAETLPRILTRGTFTTADAHIERVLPEVT